MRFVVLMGGDLTVTRRLKSQVQKARVIAADGGMAHAETLDLAPELWVGDFDSTSEELAERHRHVARHAFPAEKEKTDGEIAVDEAVRLGAREISSVGERIERLDVNADGRVTSEEMPAMFVATFGLGIAGYGGYSAPPTPPRTTAAAGQGPEWFTRMDRNGDGDLSLKEFLGTGSDFKNLDANGDGFLEAKEATAEK